jgi:hypothetical protein
MMKYLLVFLMVAVAAVTSEPTCATTPPQWTGIFKQVAWNIKEPTKLTLRIARANYDDTARKLKVTDIANKFGQLATELLDYGTRTRYFSVGGQCTKTSINATTIPAFGVPSTAKFNAAEYIGAVLPNLGVLVNEYYEVVPDTRIYLGSYAPANADGSVCVPVLISDLSAKPELHLHLLYTANVTTTLPADAFSLPPGC